MATNGLRDGLWADFNGSPLTDQVTLRERFRRNIYRGHELAQRLCRAAMRMWISAFIKPETQHLNETPPRRQQQSVRASVLAT